MVLQFISRAEKKKKISLKNRQCAVQIIFLYLHSYIFSFFELRTILIIKAAGLYCSTYYLNNYISNSVAGKYALWVAQYNYRCTYTANKYGIWQYSSEGRINGISGNVDMDYCYTDYPAIVKNCGYNGYKKTTAKKTTSTATTAKKKTVDELAKEVIAGKWAAGDERKQKLTAAGYDYNAVQKRVNELMTKPSLKSVDEIAKEVVQGKWGNGDERKAKLTSAGYDYGKVQARVNELMKNQ